MNQAWLVIGGWATSPSLLQPLFEGAEAHYVDVNELLPCCMGTGGLAADWVARCRDYLRDYLRGYCRGDRPPAIAAWSTGALVALGCATALDARACILLSSTLSFRTREDWRHGQRARVLAAMKAGMEEDRGNVLRSFFDRCGADRAQSERLLEESRRYSGDQLCGGLDFLSECNLLGSNVCSGVSSWCFHGVDDLIIPPQAGEECAGRIGATYQALEGGHWFFSGQRNLNTIRAIVERISKSEP